MKIITLIPFKNEKYLLPTAISSVKDISDEIIVINDNSTDGSDKIAEEMGAKVYNNKDLIDYGWSELSIRKNLLNLGREHGGTHFICLDADEALSSNFKNNLDIMNTLKPSQKLGMQWLAMWKTTKQYRDDYSVWSNNYKDFIFYDDGRIDFPDVWMHTPRTPGDNNHNTYIKIPKEIGGILHYQFSNWSAFQIKQSWYRCSELIKFNGGNYHEINNKYRITLDDNNVRLSNLDESFYNGFIIPNIENIYKQTEWRLIQIKEWFEKYGVDYFKDLEIWHVDEIKNLIKK
jgi:glycosyltransferase involved in cell wall biosynthesis